MRKLGIVSLALAALLLSGCNQKGEEQKVQKVEQSAPAKSEVVKQEAPAAAKPATKEEAKPAAQEEAKPAGDQAPVQEAANEAQKAAQETTQKDKEEAAVTVEKVEEVKEDVAQKTEEAQAAVDGAKLYAKCASCHGPKGDRKALGKSAVIAGMPKDEVLKKLKEYQAGTLNQYGMGPLMKGQVAGMSEAELEALADFIAKMK